MGDNVSTNEKALKELFGVMWRDYQVRCSAHIINLVVKEMLKPLNKLCNAAENVDAKRNEEMDRDGDGTIHDRVDWEIQDGGDWEVAKLDTSVGPMAKVRWVTLQLRSSTRARKVW